MTEEDNHQPSRTRRRKRSEYWDHFEQKAECKYCNALLCADPVRDGTSRLKKHYEETCPVRHPKQTTISKSSKRQQEGNHSLQDASAISVSSSDNPGHQTAAAAAAEDQLVRMIALHGFPSSLLEDVQFKIFVEMLCPDFKIPSREDVEEMGDGLFDQEMSSLKDVITRTPGLVSLSVSRAQTAMVNVMFVAVHFIDDEWNLCRRVIRVFREIYDYEDEYLYDCILDIKDYFDYSLEYDKVIETISSWGIFPKLAGASFCELYSTEIRERFFQNSHLKHLSATQHKLLHATDIHRELDSAACTLTKAYEEIEVADWFDAFLNLRLTTKKRRDVSSRLRLNHPWTYGLWYVFYYALQILHDECSSGASEIAGLVGEATFQETYTSELFRTTLGVIYNAIETVSAFSSPTSNLSIIELVKLIKKLDSEYNNAPGRTDDNNVEDTDEEQTSDDEDNEVLCDDEDNEVLSALKRTKKYLHKCFDKSYLSQSIPLILDPRYKLVYVERLLEKASLTPDDISKVQAAVRQLFQEYSNQGNAREHTNPDSQMDIATSQELNGCFGENNFFGHLDLDHSSEESSTELDLYLRDERVPIRQENFDILKWWKDNSEKYPTVARMARDFLAIPTSTRPSPQQITEITNHLRRYA